jgi:hypothetical protein
VTCLTAALLAHGHPRMCNLTKGHQAIRDLFAVKHDRAGNL